MRVADLAFDEEKFAGLARPKARPPRSVHSIAHSMPVLGFVQLDRRATRWEKAKSALLKMEVNCSGDHPTASRFVCSLSRQRSLWNHRN